MRAQTLGEDRIHVWKEPQVEFWIIGLAVLFLPVLESSVKLFWSGRFETLELMSLSSGILLLIIDRPLERSELYLWINKKKHY